MGVHAWTRLEGGLLARSRQSSWSSAAGCGDAHALPCPGRQGRASHVCSALVLPSANPHAARCADTFRRQRQSTDLQRQPIKHKGVPSKRQAGSAVLRAFGALPGASCGHAALLCCIRGAAAPGACAHACFQIKLPCRTPVICVGQLRCSPSSLAWSGQSRGIGQVSGVTPRTHATHSRMPATSACSERPS